MCINCFHTQEQDKNSIFEDICHCKDTNNFVDIDSDMLAIIQTLNNKGYYTLECCSGHPLYFTEQYNNEIMHMCSLCVIFKENYRQYFVGLNEMIEQKCGVKNVLRITWIDKPRDFSDLNRIDSQIWFEDMNKYIEVINVVKEVLMWYAVHIPNIRKEKTELTL